jgi:hypothetical protein
MTRALHTATRVQRGDPADFPRPAIERGYEASEAPPAKVALGVAAFVAVMFVGMGAAALLANVWSGGHQPSTSAATHDAREPPPPRLLANPVQQRHEIEDAAKHRLAAGTLPIDRAMSQVARRGWGEDAPAPATPQVARDHAKAAR